MGQIGNKTADGLSNVFRGDDTVIDKQQIAVSIETSNNEPISPSNPLPTQPGSINGLTGSFEDTNFVTGDSPIILDVNTKLGKNGVDGSITNDGQGNFTVEISDDGISYGDIHTLQKGDELCLKNINTSSIRITWVADSAYRVLVI